MQPCTTMQWCQTASSRLIVMCLSVLKHCTSVGFVSSHAQSAVCRQHPRSVCMALLKDTGQRMPAQHCTLNRLSRLVLPQANACFGVLAFYSATATRMQACRKKFTSDACFMAHIPACCGALVVMHDALPAGDQNAGGQNGPPSGAYIFRPDGLIVPTGLLRLHVARGPVLTELHQVFSDYTTAVIRSALLLLAAVHAARMGLHACIEGGVTSVFVLCRSHGVRPLDHM